MKDKILIVDDIQQNLTILEHQLIPLGYNVVKAVNGKEALGQLEKNSDISLILLDILMPVMDGIEACRHIKMNLGTRNIPIIFVTGVTEPEIKIKCIEAGGDDFIEKPINRYILLARTQSLLKKKHALDELQYSYNNINDIISMTEQSIVGFDPITFDYSKTNEDLIKNILNNKGEVNYRKPEYIILASKNNGDLTGRLFFKQDEELIKTPMKIAIKVHPSIASTFCLESDNSVNTDCHVKNDLVFSNWYDKVGDLAEYPKFLDEKVKESTGQILNFVACYSGELAIIVLNFGKDVNEYDAQILKGLLTHSNFLHTISDQSIITEEAFLYTIEALARASEANDEDTYSHIIRVNEYAKAIAIHLKLSERFIKDIGNFAQTHDVGKIHVARSILRKPGKLTEEEFNEMKLHTIYGVKILGNSPRLELAREIAIAHHEKYKGGGYPNNLQGEEIPMSAQITTLADVYDALRSKRHYKPAFSHEKTHNIITVGDGSTSPDDFSPAILGAFKQLHKKFEEIYFAIQDDKIQDESPNLLQAQM